ncbi:hypothetical protein BDB00DRAFT_869760 [Zychaea mexicana]|uniref:uncharacterized protein n=1 Tax=Zychaea mexicana TaxID=64656 RepID=UPI0022FF31CF|nr:uncharacterized protein BDB00DRAFT_869760 [Zychaea mexicana]KAI9496126.1 hypothetical protein BDB00DRAFT_869760 [Zychaea mexicana]
MDNNDTFFNWILDQGISSTVPDAGAAAAATAPVSSSSPQTATSLTPEQQNINNLLFHDWNDMHLSTLDESIINNNTSAPTNTSSGSSTSSVESVERGMLSQQQQQQQQHQPRSSALKPFNPHGGSINDANNKLQPTTGRLDFRVSNTDECQVTDSQLKKMTSRERRQLRNKISARNFRQRRKDYVTTLEEQVEQLQNEKSQLRLEVKNVYGIVAKLQKENDQLRVDLLLSRQDIVTITNNNTSITAQSEPFTSSSSPPTAFVTQQQLQQQTQPQQSCTDTLAVPELTFTNALSSPEDALFDTLDTDFYSNTSSSSPSSSDTNNPWDLVLPDSTWLSHAAIPRWDWSRILDKTQSSPPTSALINARDTFQRYPLLAPALMSIVVGHTMSMSAEELMHVTAVLLPSAQAQDDHMLSFDVKRLGINKAQAPLNHELLLELFKASFAAGNATTAPLITEKGTITEEDEDIEEDRDDEGNDGEKQEETEQSAVWRRPACPSAYIVPFIQRHICRVVTEMYNCVQQLEACRKSMCPMKTNDPAQPQPMPHSHCC